MKKRFNETQIIGMLKEQEAGGNTSEICRKYGISLGKPHERSRV